MPNDVRSIRSSLALHQLDMALCRFVCLLFSTFVKICNFFFDHYDSTDIRLTPECSLFTANCNLSLEKWKKKREKNYNRSLYFFISRSFSSQHNRDHAYFLNCKCSVCSWIKLRVGVDVSHCLHKIFILYLYDVQKCAEEIFLCLLWRNAAFDVLHTQNHCKAHIGRLQFSGSDA